MRRSTCWKANSGSAAAWRRSAAELAPR
jgi:hypothetical protein